MGNTTLVQKALTSGSVHPHTHGEHGESSLQGGVFGGSSPHAWGTLDTTGVEVVRDRFIPTRMGNTASFRNGFEKFSVHPHTHGEHSVGTHSFLSATGSSPHAWGTPIRGGVVDQDHRFIPTRMGNTFCFSHFLSPVSVHPHTHGEHRSNGIGVCSQRGSSPHAWGTRNQ